MPITSLNTLNNLGDIDPQYILQSLANLGQRLGVKGDSITTGFFRFQDLLSNLDESITPDSHIGLIERKNGIMSFKIQNKNSLSIDNDAFHKSLSTFGNTVKFDLSLEVKSPIEHIDAIKSNSFISTIKQNRYIVCAITQKKIEDTYTDNGFIYIEFYGDVILSALRLIVINNKAFALVIRTSNNNVILDCYYLGNTQIFEDKLGRVEDILNLMNGLSGDTSIGVSNESRIRSMSVDYWLNLLKISKYTTEYNSIETTFDFADKTIELDNLDSKNFFNNINKKYEITNIRDCFTYFQYDFNVINNFVKPYYSDVLFTSTEDSFKDQIVVALFNCVYDKFPLNAKLYIPIDYIFNYYCNSNDQWKIYGGVQDIAVRFINQSITVKNLKSFYRENQLIANIAENPQTALYNYLVEYSGDDEIYGVKVEKKYTLPFINADDYWVINNDPTGVKAKGEDAGNPNIVLIYNKHKLGETAPKINEDFNILSSAKMELVSSIGYKQKTCYVEPIDQINLEDPEAPVDSKLYKVACIVPDIQSIPLENKQAVIDLFQYSILINISTINCFDKCDEVVKSKYGDYGVVTTMWSYNEKTEDFDYIINPQRDKAALDIVGLTNLNNLVKWHIINHEPKHPDRYTHSWVVFDNAKLETKNNINDYRSYVYPVMMNKTAEDISVSDYNNDYNFFIKYNDIIPGAETNYIESVNNSSAKFISSEKTYVTNSIYKNYNSVIKEQYPEYVPKQDFPMLNLSEVFTQNQNILNRTNIISLDSLGYSYYSYIGTSFIDDNKHILRIGSSETNIHFGSETMISNNNRNIFKKQEELAIDFEDTYINGYNYVLKDLRVSQDIFTSHINWTVRQLNDRIIYSTMYVPESKMLYQGVTNETGINFYDLLIFNDDSLYKFSGNRYEKRINGVIKRYYDNAENYLKNIPYENEYKLWLPCFYKFKSESITKINKFLYLNEALYLPGLLGRLRLNGFASRLSTIDLKSNMQIIRYGGDNKYKGSPVFLLTQNRFLENIQYNASTTDPSTSFTAASSNSLFTGYPLEISYYISDNNELHLTVNELNGNPTLNNVFRIPVEFNQDNWYFDYQI